MNLPRAKTLRLILPIIMFFLAVIVFYTGTRSLENYHVDEGNWISVGNIYFHHFFVEMDFKHPDWSKNFNTWGAFQPQIAKYIIGGALHMGGFGDAREYFFDFSHSIDWNRERGNIPPDEVIVAARLPIAVLGAGLCLLIAIFAYSLKRSIVCGVIAFALAVGNPLIRGLSEVCLIDIPAQFFFLLTIFLVACLLKRAEKDMSSVKAACWALATGVAAGCAIGTKLNNLLILVFIPIIFAYSINRVNLRHKKLERQKADQQEELIKKRKILLIVLCTVLLIAMLVFYASNPFLYRNPVDGMHHMYRLSDILRWYQKVEWEAALDTNLKQIGFVSYRSFWTYGTLRSIFLLPLDIVFFLLGFVMLIKGGFESEGARGLYAGAAIVWFAVVYFGTSAWILLDWDRYYLPVIPSVIVIESVGIVAIVEMIKGLIIAEKEHNVS